MGWYSILRSVRSMCHELTYCDANMHAYEHCILQDPTNVTVINTSSLHMMQFIPMNS